jgi:Lrp/AsnC family leucine-responsive transcriptional regulator
MPSTSRVEVADVPNKIAAAATAARPEVRSDESTGVAGMTSRCPTPRGRRWRILLTVAVRLASDAVDDIDRAILLQLQDDGRLPNNELAERVGLSPSPCLRRVKRLEAAGTIQRYAAIVDPAAIGRAYEVLVWVTLREVTRESMAVIEARFAEQDEISEAFRMMGQPDYLVRVAVADAAAYESFYIDTLAALPGVQTLTSMTTMKTIKRHSPLRPT